MATHDSDPIDCIVLGGGPAGLQAALTLARVHRSVALVDAGPGRNAAAAHMQNVVTRDGTPPATFRGIAREQLEAYSTVRLLDGTAVAAVAGEDDVAVELGDGRRLRARFLVLATGVTDLPLPLPGLAPHWGGQVAHCPFCHGHELGDRVVVLGGEPQREHPVRMMVGVAQHLTWLTDGVRLDPEVADGLRRLGVVVDERRAIDVVERDGRLVGIAVEGGDVVACDGVLAGGAWQQRSTLPAALGCAMLPDGAIEVDELGATSVARVLAAGDAAHRAAAGPGHSVIASAAAGQLAALGVVRALIA
ncbi:NAD(P)/FAD-dependent oxidoreductase [Agrococcus beijingensis]|uniref:NAD(P)/FAD-dependent oxidoreductase n=1 Tax=Agrococcus beijingensis TaxID=3068634 RepID=UPI002742302B|nr:NAD(P)/FAD-dependent oxidoreductase [Agrococcus sp. REN33]